VAGEKRGERGGYLIVTVLVSGERELVEGYCVFANTLLDPPEEQHLPCSAEGS
jgi:hypothetical protein